MTTAELFEMGALALQWAETRNRQNRIDRMREGLPCDGASDGEVCYRDYPDNGERPSSALESPTDEWCENCQKRTPLFLESKALAKQGGMLLRRMLSRAKEYQK